MLPPAKPPIEFGGFPLSNTQPVNKNCRIKFFLLGGGSLFQKFCSFEAFITIIFCCECGWANINQSNAIQYLPPAEHLKNVSFSF